MYILLGEFKARGPTYVNHTTDVQVRMRRVLDYFFQEEKMQKNAKMVKEKDKRKITLKCL